MNNAMMQEGEIPQDSVLVDRIPALRKRQEHVIAVLSSIDALLRSDHWNVVESEILDRLGKLRKQLVKEKDTVEVFRLQGKIQYGEQFDLTNLAQSYRTELEGIKQQLHATNQEEH